MSGLFCFWNLIMMNLIEQLKRHEGFRSDYYQCSADKKTIGYGRNVDNNPFSSEELKMLGRDEFTAEPMTEDEYYFCDICPECRDDPNRSESYE